MRGIFCAFYNYGYQFDLLLFCDTFKCLFVISLRILYSPMRCVINAVPTLVLCGMQNSAP